MITNTFQKFGFLCLPLLSEQPGLYSFANDLRGGICVLARYVIGLYMQQCMPVRPQSGELIITRYIKHQQSGALTHFASNASFSNGPIRWAMQIASGALWSLTIYEVVLALIISYKLESCCATFKANVSQEILNWHSLRHSHSAEICIHFYCLS